MLGAIVGDIVGSIYEIHNIKTKDFPLFIKDNYFTDDTVLTVAVADVILHHGDYVSAFKTYFHQYKSAGYGPKFYNWAQSDRTEPYNSWGNGSAMRVSPIGFAYNDLETVLDQAEKSAEVTHNHPEGIKGAQATAAAIFLARTGQTKAEIKSYIEDKFGYNLHQTLEEIRPNYQFDISCQGTVPQAIVAFLESTDFEDAIRNAVSLGGDSDTLTCITGGIAHAFYGTIPDHIVAEALARLDDQLSNITRQFMSKYC